MSTKDRNSLKKQEFEPFEELSEEQYSKLIQDLEEFQEKFLKILAGTDNYEIIPTSDEHGNTLSGEQLALVKRECNRLGLTVIYAVHAGPKLTYLACPDREKFVVGILSEGAEVH